MFRKLFTGVVLVILMFITTVFSQARRIVLLEEATNASCAPCAANNPNLQAFFHKNFGGVISVRYHAWWPGSDPMYSLNVTDNTTRINYYGINGVPNYLIDGVNYGVPGDPNTMASQMWEGLTQPAPVKINITTDIDADSVRATVYLIGLSSVTQTNLFLRTGVIERKVVYTTPPGSNGEKEFPDVLRKMLPDANGISIAAINPGDTLTFNMSAEVNAAWNWSDLAVVSWLQSDASKEIIQSNINLPTYIIESPEPSAQFLDFNQTYMRNYSIYNDNPTMLHLRIVPEEIYVPAQWSYNLMYNNVAQDSFDVDLAPSDTLHFQLTVQTDNTPESIKIRVFAKNMDDAYGYGFSRTFFGLIPQGELLFVDDDGGDNYETNYYSAFDSAGVVYTSLEESDLLALASEINPSQFSAIFWNISWGFPAFVEADIDFLTNYLDNGGNFYLAGQDIGWDIFESGSNLTAAQDFYHNYLDADYLNDNSGIFTMEGVPGDPITDGISFSINSIYSRYPEWIGSYSGGSVLILKYTGQDRYGALRYDSGTYKVVYLGIGIEQMSDAAVARLIVKRTLEWFGVITDIHQNGNPQIVQEFSLEQNYPNPFNPETTIRYSLNNARAENTRLIVYNSLGQIVRTLVDAKQPAGEYQVTWDGKNNSGQQVASGIYYYQLTSGEMQSVQKMILIR